MEKNKYVGMFVCINLFFFEIITPCGSEKCKKSASTRSVYLAWHEYNAWRLYVCPSVCNVRWCLAITRCNRKWKWAHDEACRSRPTSQYSVIMNMQEQSRPVGYGKMKFCPLAVTISETVQAGTIIKKIAFGKSNGTSAGMPPKAIGSVKNCV